MAFTIDTNKKCKKLQYMVKLLNSKLLTYSEAFLVLIKNKKGLKHRVVERLIRADGLF